MSDLLCLTCAVLHNLGDRPPRRPNRPKVCDGCRTHLARLLVDLPDAMLRITVQPARGMSEILTRAFESKPPLDLDALGQLAGIGWDTPLGRLDWWARDFAETRGESMPKPTLAATVAYLADRLDWACDEHPAVDEFATDLKEIRSSLRRWDEAPIGKNAGRCPRKPGDRRCDTQLIADPYDHVIACPRCGASWDRRKGDWLELVTQQQELAA